MIQTFELNISVKLTFGTTYGPQNQKPSKYMQNSSENIALHQMKKKHYHVLTGYKTLIRAWIDAYSNYGKYTLHPVDVVTLGTISGTVYILNFN